MFYNMNCLLSLLLVNTATTSVYWECYVKLYGYLYSASHRRLFRGALSV